MKEIDTSRKEMFFELKFKISVKGRVAITDKICLLEKLISFMSNAHAGCLKVNSSRIDPITLVYPVGRPVKIVSDYHFYIKSPC